MGAKRPGGKQLEGKRLGGETSCYQTEPEVRLFANDNDRDCHQIDSIEDTLKLQKYIDQLSKWDRELSIRFQPVKCNMMRLQGYVSKRSMQFTP